MIGTGCFYKDCKKQRIYRVIRTFDYQDKGYAVVETYKPHARLEFLNVYEIDKLLKITAEIPEFEAGRLLGSWEANNGRHQD